MFKSSRASRVNLLMRGFSLSANSNNLALVNNPNIDSKIGINKIVQSIIIAKNKQSENISPLVKANFCLLIKDAFSFPIKIHWPIKAPKGTKIDNWSNWARLLIFPPKTETIQAQTYEIKNELLLIIFVDSGQLMQDIETQAKAVMLPMPWEIINAGGTIIDNGLIVEPNETFIACTDKSREMIKIICLEFIVGFSLETNIKIPQLTKTSVKDKNIQKFPNCLKDLK